MTFLELQDLFLQLVNDPNAGYFNRTDFVKPALNRALKELQKQLIMSGDLYYVKSPPAQTATIQYQADYKLPDDCLKLNRVEIETDTSTPIPSFSSIKPMTLNDRDKYGNVTGLPESYILTKDKISLYPCPDTSGLILNLWYSYQVPEMVLDADEPDAPAIFQEYIAVIAVIDAKIKDETVEANIKEKQMRYENLMKQMAMDRSYDKPRMINILDSDSTWTAY